MPVPTAATPPDTAPLSLGRSFSLSFSLPWSSCNLQPTAQSSHGNLTLTHFTPNPDDGFFARKQLAGQVTQLEAQLERAGEGVEHEKEEMEKVLLRLSDALSGVDLELTQSAVSGVCTKRLVLY